MKDTFEHKLFETLKQNKEFLSTDGEVLKDRVIDSAYKVNRELIELLLKNNEIKKKFFTEIQGHWVFNINDFVMFVQDKHFLNDSYTKYKNKIGLTIDGKFLNERKEVALVWPFKDGVLEGGMSKEDQKKKEIFFNEILAQDEIDKLFAPKVLTNWKRYTSKGVKEVKELKRDESGTIKENLIIKGNNLLVLHTLKEHFQRKVKLIYIDPPYYFKDIKPEDTFSYNSNFKLSTWLTFMKNRLEIAKDLLRDDGAIFVQIKDDGMAHLKILLDEIFGIDNFVNNIVVKMSEASGVKMAHSEKRFPNIKEYILFYKKSSSFDGFYKIDKWKSTEWDKENNIFLENFEFSDRQKLLKIEEKENITEADIKLVNEVLKKVKKTSLSEKIKSIPKEKLQEWLIENSYRIIKTAGSSSLAKQVKELKNIPKQNIASFTSRENILFYFITDFNKNTDTPRLQVLFADTSIYKNPCDFWQDIKTTGAIANERGVQLSGGKKPEKLIHRIIDMTTNEGDIILDYHSGSGTTAGVAHKMKRQWITIEQIDNQINLSLKGIRNVISGDSTGISELVNWKGGGDFIYCELGKYNEDFVKQIEDVSDSKSFLRIWEEMKEKAFFKHNFEMQEFEKNIEQFKKLDLKKQKQVLCEILDKNQLYVNYSEIEDKKFKVDKKDKKINKEFYEKDGL